MKTSILILLMAVCCLAVPEFASARGIPVPEDWQPAGAQRSFGPDSLWVPVNGAADQFISYGFKQLRCRDLRQGEVLVSVSLYDMGTPLNAFGIFGVETSSGGEAAAIGARTLLALSYQALMLKGSYYVKVEAFGGGLTAETAASLLTAIAAVIPGDTALPPELELLPAPDRVPGSEAYTGESWLGLRSLSRCLHAEYRSEAGQEFVVFVMVPEAQEDVDAIWSRLAKKWRAISADGIDMLLKKIPYRGSVGVVRCGEIILGVTATGNDEEVRALLVQYAKQPMK